MTLVRGYLSRVREYLSLVRGYLSLVIGYSSLVGRYLNLVRGRLKTAGYIAYLCNNQINARALIGQSAMGYCYRVFQVWFRTKQML